MKRAWRVAAILACLAGALAVGVVLVARSDWLREQVRAKIVEVLEKSTGGKATLARFDYDWSTLRATVEDLTLRGKEDPSRAPLFHVDAVSVAIDIRSWIGKDIELRELTASKPEVHIYVAEDGSTNLPGTQRAPGKGPVEQLVDLEIAKLRIDDGVFEYDSKRIPMNITAEGLKTELTFVHSPKHYAVTLQAARLRLPAEVNTGVDLTGRLLANRFEFKGTVRLADGNSTVDLDGALDDFKHPKAKSAYRLTAAARDLHLKQLRQGSFSSHGTATWDSSGAYSVAGSLEGRGIAVETPEFTMRGANFTAEAAMNAERIAATAIRANGFGGTATGSATLEGFKRLHVKGVLDAPVSALLAMARSKPLPWDGSVRAPFEFSGDLERDGVRNSSASAEIALSSMPEQLPAEGNIAARWSQREGTVAFEPSTLRVPDISANFQGTLGQRMEVGILASNLKSIEPYAGLFNGGKEFALPVRLDKGQASLEATVTGPIDDPVIEGTLTAQSALYEGVHLERMETQFTATRSELILRGLQLAQNGARATGNARVGLSDWKPAPSLPLQLQLTARGIDLKQLARLSNSTLDVAGKADAQLSAQGTIGAPQAALKFASEELTIAGERLRKVSGDAKTEGETTARFNAAAQVAGAPVSVTGAFQHPADEWRQGTLSVAVKASKLRAGELEFVRKLRPEAEALIGADARATLTVQSGGVQLSSVDGWAEASDIRDNKFALGSLRVESATADGAAHLAISGRMGESEATGQASVRLSSGYPGAGRVAVKDMPLEFIAQYIALAGKDERPMPVAGGMDAEFRWRGRLSTMDDLSGIVTISRLNLQRKGAAGELAVTNAGPMQFEIDKHGIQVRNARLLARETSVTVAGLYSFNSRTPWDMSVNGTMNLAVLNTFEKDLTAAGTARLTANVRGSADRPSVSGRMMVENGSLYLKGMPNGLENANGSFFFERDRATVETFTATTGGGQFTMSGFVGFGSGEMSYRLQASATKVRVRYPEGVSTTLDADLSLTGSSHANLLSGTATIQRSGFSAQGDLGSYIAGSANPIPVPSTQSEFLRNLQFDVRVRAAPDAAFQTDYTQDIQMEADLRLRGSPAKPVVLGNVRVNQGEVNFFGNRYTISRGEIVFFNTVTIQPSINLDLETRIRGVTVYINISGPLSRLNVNYRSEPPLQSSEILALLTVGRQPTATSGNVPTTSVATSAAQPLGDAGNTLLGGALSASVSSRVERFFGASRIKIDPNSTGVENIPQARLTVEQSLSRDITLTYSTNLSRTSQQIIRMEWNFSREWSAVAVRDENGRFGVDFLFRKRFK